MEIIKKGRVQKGWSKECVCTGQGNGGGGCGTHLLVCYGDLYSTASHHYDGSSESYTTFQCVSCGVETDIPDYRGPHGLPTKKEWLVRKNEAV